MTKLHECNDYPCYEYRAIGWGNRMPARKVAALLRRRHSKHSMIIGDGEAFRKGWYLRGINFGGAPFASLIHKGRKRRK